MCKYHILYQGIVEKVFYESKRLKIEQILRQLCEWKRNNNNKSKSMLRPYPFVS